MDCRYYPHSLGHWLGMDTHDAALNSLDLPLQPNVVLTIEPGACAPRLSPLSLPRSLPGLSLGRLAVFLVNHDHFTVEKKG